MNSDLLGRFPALRNLENPAIKILDKSSRVVRLPPGAKAFEPGMQCDNYLMVASGRIRVQQVSESGREIVLYRIGDGKSCVLTTACLLARERVLGGGHRRDGGFGACRSSDQFRKACCQITALSGLCVHGLRKSHHGFDAAGRGDCLRAYRHPSGPLLELSDRVNSLSLTHHELSVEAAGRRPRGRCHKPAILKDIERGGGCRLRARAGKCVIRDRGAVSSLAGLTPICDLSHRRPTGGTSRLPM